MKKLTILFVLAILISSSVIAADKNNYPTGKYQVHTKCLDLMTSMYNERETMYNVLNLTQDQIKCKNQIDKERYQELDVVFNQLMQEKYVLKKLCENGADTASVKKQEKIIDTYEKKLKDTADKYDEEFLSILNSEQRSKYKTVKKMARKEIKYCQKNKAFYKRDPKLRPFGQAMYTTDNETSLCPKHKIWHLFGRKCRPEE